jgi:type IV pilus assembly protein PilF
MKRFFLAALAPWIAVALAAGCASTRPVSEAPVLADGGTPSGETSDPRNRARIRTELASLYYGRGNMGIALEELRLALQADSTYAPAYSMFGLVYMQLKENGLAQQNFDRALQLAPTDPDINHNYGWYLCQTGRENGSIRYFLQAVRNPLYPTPWKSYAAAGQCSLQKDNLKDAQGYFESALALEPDEPVSLLKLGQIHYRNARYEDARKSVARVNRLVEPSAESLWLALRIERRLGDKNAETAFANQLRRRFAASSEYQSLQRGEYD